MKNYVLKINNLNYSDSNSNIKELNLLVRSGEIRTLLTSNNIDLKRFFFVIQNIQSVLIKGNVYLRECSLIDSNRSLRELGILFVEPGSMQMEEMRVFESLYINNLPKINYSPFIDWRKVKKNATHLIDKFRLNIDINSKIKDLSDEEKKLIYIASKLIQKPEIIVFNEPFYGMSINSKTKIDTLLEDYLNHGGAVLFLTNHWEEALRISTNISVLTDGVIVDELSGEDAKKNPKRILKNMNSYNYKEKTSSEKHDYSALKSVFKAAEFLSSEYELKEVLGLLAREVTNFMSAERCIIKLLDESTWSIIDEIDYNENAYGNISLKKESIINIVEQKDIFYCNGKDKDYSNLFEANNDFKTFICVPVMIKSRVAGVIEIYYSDYYIYSSDEYMYLEALRHHAAIAIEETRLIGKSTLLQESHHRIKNNLESIIGIITLQKQFITEDSKTNVENILDGIISRISSISAVHNILSHSKMGNSIITLKEIVYKIIKLSDFENEIKLNLEIDDIPISYNKATSIAIIINELIMNSVKHAYPENSNGIVNIRIKKVNKVLILIIKDNGVGFPEGFSLSKLSSLGLNIIKGILSHELNGTININSDNGALITIEIPDNKKPGNYF